MKYCYFILALLLAASPATAQTVTVHSGATATVQNSSTVTTYGSLSIDGAIETQAQTRLHFAGPGGTLSAAALLRIHGLYLGLDDPANALLLATGLDIRETLTIARGDIDLNGNTVDLGTTGQLSEQSGHTVRGEAGQIQAIREVGVPNAVDVGGLGAIITTDANLGEVTVVRKHSLSQINGASSIRRNYDITPTGTNTNLNATLTLRYDGSEVGAVTESDLEIYQTDDDGQTWFRTDSDVNVNANTVTATDLNSLSGFTPAADLSEMLLLAGTMLLEGPYIGEGNMTASLTANLPEADPYGMGWDVDAGFFGTPEGQEIVDWVWMQFRTGDPANPPMQIVYERAALLHRDGQIVGTDGLSDVSIAGLQGGSYYLVVGHRNHLAAMTNAPVSCTEAACTANLTTQPAYGTEGTAQVEPDLFALYAGDASSNGQVQDNDKDIQWTNQSGAAGYQSADFNLNGQVQNNDKNTYWTRSSGRISQVPAAPGTQTPSKQH